VPLPLKKERKSAAQRNEGERKALRKSRSSIGSSRDLFFFLPLLDLFFKFSLKLSKLY